MQLPLDVQDGSYGLGDVVSDDADAYSTYGLGDVVSDDAGAYSTYGLGDVVSSIKLS